MGDRLDLELLRRYLDLHYHAFDYATYRRRDPVALLDPYRGGDLRDLELAALVASSLAYGQVDTIMTSGAWVLSRLGSRPARVVSELGPARLSRRLSGLRHRWSRGADMSWLLWGARRVQEGAGSLGDLLAALDDRGTPDLGAGLTRLVAAIRAAAAEGGGGLTPRRRFLLPSPSDGSTCKRLCMAVRWMVRRPEAPDGVDLGCWRAIDPARLVLPIDTHTKRLARYLGLVRRLSPGWPMALEATQSLRRLDPADPVKYDFALAHLGIHKLCAHRRVRDICGACPLDPACLLT